MRRISLTRQTVILLAAAGLLTAPACSDRRAEAKARDRSWQQHVPATSDMVVAADLDELRETDWYSEDALAPRSNELAEKAGFSYDDIKSFVLSCDLDSLPSLESLRSAVKLDESGQPDASALTGANLQGINATILLCLTKPISWEQTEAAVNVFFASITNATITRAAGEQAMIVRQSSSLVPLRVTLSADGRVLKMRAGDAAGKAGSAGDLNQLFARDNAIALHGPLRVTMQTSGKMRRRLQEAAAGSKDQAAQDSTAMLVGTALKPFVSFEGLAVAITPSQEATKVFGEMEFGSEEHALEAEVAINNILIPLITLTLTQNSEGPIMEPILQKTSTYVRGSKLELKATLNPPSTEDRTGASAD